MASTRKRQDQTVQWLKPKTPVLPAYRPNCVGVLTDKPARAEQTLSTLRLACELAGILNRVTTHDLRRGLARDVSYLPQASKINVTEAASALGHTHATMTKGITRAYIGPDKRDLWSARLQQAQLGDDEAFGLEMVNIPFKRRKHTSTELLKTTCVENGIDYEKRGD